jgi:hypothetical protein
MTDKLLNERANTHGNFCDVSKTTQTLYNSLRGGQSFDKLSDSQREALHMCCSKLARIVNGNPNFKDHWDDIAGYTTLISKGLT